MSRELLLLRHGKSDWDNDPEDFYRPLKDRGKRGAQKIGCWLQQQRQEPDCFLSSPAVRALETARKCIKAMGGTSDAIHQDARIYEASVEQLLEVLADYPTQPQRLLMVGHNPGFEELLTWLLGEGLEMPEDGKLLPTATLVRLQLPDDWRGLTPGCARLLETVRARNLPKQFPFVTDQGVEYRDRPAYYYCQSAVIPYRIRQGQVQILLVTSSGKNHWVVPKGIQEPGLTAQESAAKEALEEAGVLDGQVAAEPFGQYSYNKWGGRCQVSVYPMKVKRMKVDADWDMGCRQRKWVPSSKVAGYLKQPELADMALALARQLVSR